jgi:hypothetical protein
MQGRVREAKDRRKYPDWVMAGLDPAIPLKVARLCPHDRDRRVKPGDDGLYWVGYSAA